MFAIAVVAEGLLREALVWRPIAVLAGLVLFSTLLWRRSHPLLAVLVGFGGTALLDLATFAVGLESAGLFAMAGIVILPYSLLRWGSGRQATIGLALMATTHLVNMVIYVDSGAVSALTGFAFILFPAALGASVRYWTQERSNELERVRVREREQLARELHDTVAHHVSAIAIQAQAGNALAESQPASALDVLDVIETEATQTLEEMRSIVAILRNGAAPELAPNRGITSIADLAQAVDGRPTVAVHLSGELDSLRPSVGATVYRLAQESVTNAIKHSRRATRIEVLVAADGDTVQLVVDDNGERPSFDKALSGYGLVGMAERATLLGGTLEAGPGPRKGWTVRAVIPRNGAES
ncbi:MAG: sensor histidine kinase [bacterium]|nr:sensor histidine kinase [bacterium]